MRRHPRYLTALSGCFLLLANGASAAELPSPECAPGAAYPYPKAVQAISAWNTSQLAVASAVTENVLHEYCVQAKAAAIERNVPASRLDEIAGSVLAAHLAREADGNKTRPPLGALIRTQLGANGLSRPVYKQTVRLELIYAQPIDVLRVGSDTFSQVGSVFVPPGRIHLEGSKAGKPVCVTDLMLQIGPPTSYTCGTNKP